MTDAMLKEHQSRSYLSILGPGILFAGAAIGTSHLVQSTRAGAVYGIGLFIFVLLANLLKYPSFKFGPYCAAVTGRSLIEAYRTQGRLYVVLIALSQFAGGTDKAKLADVANQLEAGTIYINKHAELSPHVPFGGIKCSGLGVEFAEEGLAAYTSIRVTYAAA